MVSWTETDQDRAEALGNIKALNMTDHNNNDNNGSDNNDPFRISSSSSSSTASNNDKNQNRASRKPRKAYKRKREKPITEKEADQIQQQRQAEYEEIVMIAGTPASIWAFENLFPEPVWDETSIQRDLFLKGATTTTTTTEKRDKKSSSSSLMDQQPPPPPSVRTSAAARNDKNDTKGPSTKMPKKLRSSIAGSSIMRLWRDQKLSHTTTTTNSDETPIRTIPTEADTPTITSTVWKDLALSENRTVDFQMTQRVEGAVYGIRPTTAGNKNSEFIYDTSLMGGGAVQFRDGVRLGNALRVNADRLTYLAKKEMARNRLEEAQELYEQALAIDPRDGRAYLGLSRIAEKRRDFKLARQCLRSGIANSVSIGPDDQPDFGGNPFLLQALGYLEENSGRLSEAEALYISAARSRPSHAAAWVALAQLRTRKLRQNAAAGRICFQTAERELKRANLPPSAHVYTAWAALEYKKAGDVRRARELFQLALDVDPKCSAAFLQLGVMEADKENWDAAAKCFDAVLKYDKRNSRVLQAFAIMESRRPDGSSRKAIDLFERALEANPRDAIVLQAYALFVVKLGDINAAKSLYVPSAWH